MANGWKHIYWLQRYIRQKTALYKRMLKGSQTSCLNELLVERSCTTLIANQVAVKIIIVKTNRGEKSEHLLNALFNSTGSVENNETMPFFSLFSQKFE